MKLYLFDTQCCQNNKDSRYLKTIFKLVMRVKLSYILLVLSSKLVITQLFMCNVKYKPSAEVFTTVKDVVRQ